MITKRDFIQRGSCFYEKYNNLYTRSKQMFRMRIHRELNVIMFLKQNVSCAIVL